LSTGEPQLRLRIIGAGRAGRSIGMALEDAGFALAGYLGRDDDPRDAAAGVDLLLIATPDSAIAGVAEAVRPRTETVVAHLAGSLGIGVLAPHPRRAAIHPLMPLPDPRTGAARLVGATFAVAGDPMAWRVVEALRGRALPVAEPDRARYHAAACIASNHLVALLGQVDRVAATAGVPLDAYLGLVRATVDDVAAYGPAVALTGPVARGDWETVGRHLDALPARERPAYQAMAEETARLAGTGLAGTRLEAAGTEREPVPCR